MPSYKLVTVPNCSKKDQWYIIEKGGITIAEIPAGENTLDRARLVLRALTASNGDAHVVFEPKYADVDEVRRRLWEAFRCGYQSSRPRELIIDADIWEMAEALWAEYYS